MRSAAPGPGPAAERGRRSAWPHRTLWPTRDGWWCLAVAVGLGFAAMNTGNNLLYLLVSMLLGLIIVSGVLSEQTMRGLHFTPIVPEEVYAGRPALLGVRVVNGKRWRTSYSVVLEVVDEDSLGHAVRIARLDPGAEAFVTWESVFRARGRRPFPGVRVTTAFPFGLFVKSGHVDVACDLIVFPALQSLERTVVRELALGPASVRRRGRGTEVHNLREYRPGDDPRLIHWRSSAKTTELVVREFEADAAIDVRLILEGAGRDRSRLEAGLSEAASLASHLLRAGAGVELVTPAAAEPLGRGAEHRRRLLTALALYDPSAAAGSARSSCHRALREIRVSIG